MFLFNVNTTKIIKISTIYPNDKNKYASILIVHIFVLSNQHFSLSSTQAIDWNLCIFGCLNHNVDRKLIYRLVYHHALNFIFQNVDPNDLHRVVDVLCTASRAYSAQWNLRRAQELASLAVQYARYAYEITHDDVIKWNHFPRYWPFVRGIHLSTVTLMFLWSAPEQTVELETPSSVIVILRVALYGISANRGPRAFW